MNEHHYFGFIKEPFSSDIRVEDLYQTSALNATTERILYAVRLGAVSVVTSGKSTALRDASSKLHPSGYKIIPVIASTGSMVEMLAQICIGLDIAHTIMSISKLMKMIRDVVRETAQRKQVPVLIIDEANLMRFEVFAELHTLVPVRHGLETTFTPHPRRTE